MRKLYSSIEQRVEVLKNNPYFALLPQSALDELAAATQLRSYDKEEVIFLEGEECVGLFILHKGGVKLSKLSPSGREVIFKTLGEGATFNEVPVFDGGPHAVNATALEGCQLWVVPPAIIRDMLTRYPQMGRAVILNLAKNLRMFVELVHNVSLYQVTHRLARCLLELPIDPVSGKRIKKVTQVQLAAQLGTVREVLARALKELQRAGAVRIARGKIEVIDEHLLRLWLETN
ncbi:MAG: Crp/Fnr family transcriptional regulator [Anaerolineales bacterium]|nr:Crp/Fnr family transcriptional regulator [Anaerolineales bacterium]